MQESSTHWLDAQAIERLAQHIPFESDPRTKAELIEMLREIVLRVGTEIDRAVFGDEARDSLTRLGLWNRLGGADPGDDLHEAPGAR
jgi:hypothetical protein